MNKYQEALDSFERTYRNVTLDDDLTNEKRDTLQELVDKTTPMKPLKSEWDGYRLCGNCNSIIVSTNQTLPNHCSSCGQKLDWSDVT